MCGTNPVQLHISVAVREIERDVTAEWTLDGATNAGFPTYGEKHNFIQLFEEGCSSWGVKVPCCVASILMDAGDAHPCRKWMCVCVFHVIVTCRRGLFAGFFLNFISDLAHTHTMC